MLKGKLHMSIISKRLVSIAASTLVLSLVSASANAQFDVLTGLSNNGGKSSGPYEATYTFNQSMILNSIGFASRGEGLTTVSYTLNDTLFNLSESDLLSVDSNGLQWYNLANGGLSVNASSVLKVTTQGALYSAPYDPFDPFPPQDFYTTYELGVGSTNPNSNVTYNGLSGAYSVPVDFITNSNLRVSPANPGSNVAPEPGSFALALTGGAALIGICVRRRRNAG
jgi:hypothetical protein